MRTTKKKCSLTGTLGPMMLLIGDMAVVSERGLLSCDMSGAEEKGEEAAVVAAVLVDELPAGDAGEVVEEEEEGEVIALTCCSNWLRM